MDLVIGAHHGYPRAFWTEEQSVHGNRQTRELYRDGEVDFSVRAGQQASVRVGHINFGKEGTRCRINGIGGAHYFAAKFLARIFAQLNVGRQSRADRGSVALRNAYEDA